MGSWSCLRGVLDGGLGGFGLGWALVRVAGRRDGGRASSMDNARGRP